MATFEIGAFTEAELLEQGTAGSNIGYGDVFTMPSSTSVVMDVWDNDNSLSGDGSRWSDDRATDYYGQTATITENGEEVSSGNQIYAESYYWVQDQGGNWYIMIEIEVEGNNDDYFTFYGDVPPEGSVLTVSCEKNVKCNWVTYDCLMEPNSISPPLALDDTASISEQETASLNVLTNDVDIDGDSLTVTAVEGGEVGQPFEVNSAEGYSAMVTLNADGSMTVVPGPEFVQMAAGETTTISFEYTITDADGLTSTATVAVEVNGETTLEAANDAIIVSESEGAGDTDGNALDNDSIDGAAYEGNVVAVEGEDANVGNWIEGADGGRIQINADGSFDFDAQGDFDYLDEGESATVDFSYQISATGEVIAAEKQNILFVVDVSGSTENQFAGEAVGDLNGDGHSNTILDAQIASYQALSQQIADMNLDPAMVDIGIVCFSTNGAVVGTFEPGSAALDNALASLNDGGMTNFDDALDKSIDWFGTVGATPADNNVMFFLSDGEVTEGGTNFANEMSVLEGTYDVKSHAVGVGNNTNLNELNAIDNTDGAQIVTTTDALTAELSNALTELVDITDTATITVTVEGEADPEIIANDDAIVVSEDEGAGDLDGNALENDTYDGVAFTGQVSAVNGSTENVGQAIEGSNGGKITLNADGSFDFDANGAFDALDTGESAQTTFSYQISQEGEATAAQKQNVLFVVDVSGSTSDQFAGDAVGDLNGDGMSNTILDAQIASYQALSAKIADMNLDPAMVDVGIVMFSTEGAVVGTFEPGSAELDAALAGLSDGGWTNFDSALDNSIDWFGTVGATTDDNNVMFFLSDGEVTQGGTDFADEVATLEASYGVTSIAVGVGNNTNLNELNAIDNTDGAEIVTTSEGLTAELINGLTETVDISDTATITVTVEGKTDYVAVSDTLTVFASEGAGDADLLDTGAASVLENDIEENGAYAGSVEAVNDAAANIGVAVAGTNGGLLTINADGTVDFDANGEFDDLLDGQSETTTFTYAIADGKTAGVTVTVNGETVREANDDVITVSESESFGDADLLDSGEASVLANDVQNGGAYTDVVGTVEGDMANVNTFVAGSNGGLLKVNADGSVDFDANSEFEALADGESAQTTFTYTLISGEEATITVNVNGETDYDAADDVLTVMESETAGDLETLDDGSTSVLANDTQDGGVYGGDVLGNAGVQVTGSNGGLATIYADGSIDFDANDEFDYLADGETASTVFTYEIAGGETADVTVNIQGEDDASTGGGVLNLAIMFSAAQSMYATAQGTVIGVPAYPDVNGDGQDNQLIDMAYLMLNDFMSDAFDVAAASGFELNVSLISFGGNGNGLGPQYWEVNNSASWEGQLEAKVSADDSADYGKGFENANAWFDTVTTADSTNAVFVVGDGFATGTWIGERADLIAEHNAEIDAYFPDLDLGTSGGFGTLAAMDTDGWADMVFTDDAGLAASVGSVSALEILDVNNLVTVDPSLDLTLTIG